MENSENINELLHKWYLAKEDIKDLEKKIDKYKVNIEYELHKQNKKYISTSDYSIEKRKISKTYVKKEDIPTEIWEKYCKRISFDSYYLKKIKKNK